MATGQWKDGRVATVRGIRAGPSDYGCLAFTELNGDNNQVIVGRPDINLSVDAWPSVRELLAVDRETFYGDDAERYYAAAWGLVHELYARHPGELMRYLGALRAGSTPQSAWRTVFGSSSKGARAAAR